MAEFDIPVVLFIFKRLKAVDIVKRIGEVKPKRLYILADEGRNEEERKETALCRELVEAAIDWECDIIKNYAIINRGVYKNIGEGAKWVFSKERSAIFLEDDNLPEISFFYFCKEMLQKYENDTRILWICGTNYLGDYKTKDNVSYVFTRHMLPCGWASWNSKFLEFYDGELSLCSNETVVTRLADNYCNKAVYNQYKENWMSEYKLIQEGKQPTSWDYQMDFAIKANGLLGICPCKNQIRNIGVDEYATHGGNSMSLVMTKRFCGMKSYLLDFPLIHPNTVLVDPDFEKSIGKVILYPLSMRMRRCVSFHLRKLLNVPQGKSFKRFILDGFK